MKFLPSLLQGRPGLYTDGTDKTQVSVPSFLCLTGNRQENMESRFCLRF